MDKHIIVFAQSIEQPRVVKRILELANNYEKVTVYAFSRGIYEVGNYKNIENHNNIDIIILGTLQNEKYFSRIGLYLKFIVNILNKHGFKPKQIYVFGLDLRIVTFGIPNAKVYYEISDIIWLYKTGIIKKVFSKIDTYLTKKSYGITFTSEGFFNKYYYFLDPKKVVIKENKFKTYDKVKPIELINLENIKIAYIGSFRYHEIIKALINVVSKNNNLDLNFYGDSNTSIILDVKKLLILTKTLVMKENSKNPDDLERIYSENNLNFVVYDNKLENEQVAMPNKYYESGYFNIPIVAATNTFVGEMVQKMEMGWSIEATEKSFEKFLSEITIDDILKYHQHIKTIDKSFLKYKNAKK